MNYEGKRQLMLETYCKNGQVHLEIELQHELAGNLNEADIREFIKDFLELGYITPDSKVLANGGILMGHHITNKGKNFLEKGGFTTSNDLKKERKQMATKTRKIFISHATANKEIVSQFCDMILHNGLNINLSEEVFNTSLEGSKPTTGEDFRVRIKSELENAEIVLQFISKEYKQSEVCLNEMGAAWVLSTKVIPLIVDGTYDVGFIHNTTQQAQLYDENHLLKLVQEIKDIVGNDVRIDRVTAKVKEFVSWITSSRTLGVESKGVKPIEQSAQVLVKEIASKIWVENFRGPGSWIFNYWTSDEGQENTKNRLVNNVMTFQATKASLGNSSGQFGALIDIPGLAIGNVYEVKCKVTSTPGSTMGFQLWVHDGQTGKNSVRDPLALKTPSSQYSETMKVKYTINQSGAMRIHLNCSGGKGKIKVSEVSVFKLSESKIIPGQPSESDVSMIANYMDSRRFIIMTLEAIQKRIHHKFTEEFILALIEKFPDDFCRATLRNQPALRNLIPTFKD